MPTPNLDQQLRSAVTAFEKRFKAKPTVAVAAPGRVNLIGEHTDYNGGFVMPMAIDRQTVIVARPNGGNTAWVVSADFPTEASFAVGPGLARGTPSWSNYIRGAVAMMQERGVTPPGFDALLSSTVPPGGGLSSSASIEVATATLVEALAGQKIDPVDKALSCQKAEHQFAGVPCGIMDQFISTMGQAGHALLIDCRSYETTPVPLDDPSIVVLIINSNVKHELTGGEYAERRAQCEKAARTLGVELLRDATMEQLEAAKSKMDDVTYRRARHVIGENQRALDAAEAMRKRDWSAMGRLMRQSHDSLRDDFEVSTPELDRLVDLAYERHESAGGGVIGSRMTGGGFGGCTVSLVRKDNVERIGAEIADAYQAAVGEAPSVFVTVPSPGARVLDLGR